MMSISCLSSDVGSLGGNFPSRREPIPHPRNHEEFYKSKYSTKSPGWVSTWDQELRSQTWYLSTKSLWPSYVEDVITSAILWTRKLKLKEGWKLSGTTQAQFQNTGGKPRVGPGSATKSQYLLGPATWALRLSVLSSFAWYWNCMPLKACCEDHVKEHGEICQHCTRHMPTVDNYHYYW